MRKILALLIVLVMLMSLTLTAFAAEDATIKIEQPAANHNYTAYQIFTGDYDPDTEALSNFAWGDGVDHENLLTALQKDFATYFGTAAAAGGVATGLEAMEDANEDLTPVFALIKEHLLDDPDSEVGDKGKTGALDASDGYYYINNLSAGYYMIVDPDSTLGDQAPVMVKVVRGMTQLLPKSNEISAQLFVLDTDPRIAAGSTVDEVKDGSSLAPFYQSGWVDVADYNIGDDYIYMSVFVDLPDLSAFDYYNVLTTVELPKGLSFEEVKFYYVNNKEVSTPVLASQADATSQFVYSASVDDAGVTTIKFYPNRQGTSPSAPDDQNGGDIKAIINESEIENYDLLQFTWLCRLNENADIGLPGNAAKSYVKATKEPNSTEYITTPEDEAVVFTYELDVTKVDSADNELVLEGAQFILMRYNLDTQANDYARFDNEGRIVEWAAYPDTPIEGETVEINGKNRYEDSILTSDENGLMKIKGLDDGYYCFLEIVAPDGYNLLEKQIFVDIIAEHGDAEYIFNSANAEKNPALTGLEITTQVEGSEKKTTGEGSATTGIVNAMIENSYHAVLPETGGVGTTLFYIFGSLMVVGAAVVLVTKRRMAA